MLEAIQENLRFLIIEVEKQLERTAQYVKEPDRELLQAVIAGDDYVDNLKDTIQSKVFVTAARSIIDDPVVRLLRAYEVVAVNLERISDFCEHVVVQVGYVEDQNVAKSYDFEPFFDEIIAGVRGIERALRQQDTQSALVAVKIRSTRCTAKHSNVFCMTSGVTSRLRASSRCCSSPITWSAWEIRC